MTEFEMIEAGLTGSLAEGNMAGVIRKVFLNFSAETGGDVPFTGTDVTNWNTAFGWGNWATGVNKTFVDALSINAAYLGGQDASYYYPASNPNGYITSASLPTNYVATTGGTFTGNVVFSSNLLTSKLYDQLDSSNYLDFSTSNFIQLVSGGNWQLQAKNGVGVRISSLVAGGDGIVLTDSDGTLFRLGIGTGLSISGGDLISSGGTGGTLDGGGTSAWWAKWGGATTLTNAGMFDSGNFSFLRSPANGIGGMAFQDLAGNTRGYVYHSGSDFGLLYAGGWMLRGTGSENISYQNFQIGDGSADRKLRLASSTASYYDIETIGRNLHFKEEGVDVLKYVYSTSAGNGSWNFETQAIFNGNMVGLVMYDRTNTNNWFNFYGGATSGYQLVIDGNWKLQAEASVIRTSVALDVGGQVSTPSHGNSSNWFVGYQQSAASLDFNTSTGVLSLGRTAASTMTASLDGRYIHTVTAGTNLTGGGTGGSVTVNLASSISLTAVTASDAFYTVSHGNSANWLVGYQQSAASLSYDSGTGVLTLGRTSASSLTATITAGAGDITEVIAGTNLTGGGTSGAVTVNLASSISLTRVTASDGIFTSAFAGTFRASNFGVYISVDVPSSMTDTGEAGTIRPTSTGIYVCIATNTWRKAALTTF